MVKLLLFGVWVTNYMGELLFSHVRVTKILKISSYIWNYWLVLWKKTKCWSRIIVIRDFFIEIKYHTIQNIWKEIGQLNFVIIDVDLALKRYRWRSWYYSTHGLHHVITFFLYLVLFVSKRWYLFTYAVFVWLMQV